MDRSNTPPHHGPPVPHGHHGHLAADGVQQRRWLVLLAMTGSLAMIFVDMTVVGVALPRMASALSMSDVDQAWIITSYLITLASLMALGGRIGDLIGKVPTFIAGGVSFALASIMCASAHDGTQLIVGRVLQGVAACLMQPASVHLSSAHLHQVSVAKPWRSMWEFRWFSWRSDQRLVDSLLRTWDGHGCSGRMFQWRLALSH